MCKQRDINIDKIILIKFDKTIQARGFLYLSHLFI